MPFHLTGWAQDIDLGGTAQGLTALADEIVVTSGDNLRIPELPNLLAAMVGLASDTALEPEARINAPSQQRYLPVHLLPVNGATDADVEPSTPQAVSDFREAPIEFTRSEDASVVVNGDSSAAAFQWVLGLWGSGVDPVPAGRRMVARYTSGTTVTARAWSNCALTFQQALPVGRYAVIGLRPMAATAIAARIVYRGGAAGSWRPGALACDKESDLQHEMFRQGGLGSWGEFESDNPPSLEYLCGSADTAEEGLIDLVLVREGRV